MYCTIMTIYTVSEKKILMKKEWRNNALITDTKSLRIVEITHVYIAVNYFFK